MKNLFFLLGFALFVMSCGDSSSASNEQESHDSSNTETVTDNASQQLCFLKVNKNEPIVVGDQTYPMSDDSTYVQITIEADGSASGIYNYLPAEKDATRGTFTGKLNDENVIVAECTFTQEGEEYKDEVSFELSDDKVVVVEQNHATPLPKVDCN